MSKQHTTLMLRVALAVAAAPVVTLIYARTWSWAGVAFNALAVAAFTVGIGWLVDRLVAGLHARMHADASCEWEAHLNGVTLGAISDADYAAIQLSVYRDVRVALMQAMNFVQVARTVLNGFVFGLPIAAFWIAAGLAVWAPASCIDFVNSMIAADASTIASTTAQFLQVCLVVHLVGFGLMVAVGSRFGYRDCYYNEVGRLLCQHFKTPVTGEVTLWRLAQRTQRAGA